MISNNCSFLSRARPDSTADNKKQEDSLATVLLFWWRWPDSNRRPPACGADALPAELHLRDSSWESITYSLMKVNVPKAIKPSEQNKCGDPWGN